MIGEGILGIGTAIKHVKQIINLADKAVHGDMTLNDQSHALKKIALITSNGSITKLLANYIIEPVIIATHTARDVDQGLFDKLAQLNTDIFTSFYMQAFKIINEQLGMDVNTSILLLSSNTSPYTLTMGREENTSYLDMVLGPNKLLKVSTEAKNKEVDIHLSDRMDDIDQQPLYSTLERQVEIKLTVGKDKRTIVIPITVKAHLIITSINSILNMLNPSKHDKSFSYRLDEYRAGAISLSELIFCTDLIKQYKQNKIKDKDHLLEIINSRVMSSNTKLGLTGVAKGYEQNYNMLIVSSADKVKLDAHIVGDITNERFKQMLLEQAHALTISIVDDDYERVSIYTRDIRGSSNIGFNALKKRKDKDSNGLEELMKAMFMNKPMSF